MRAERIAVSEVTNTFAAAQEIAGKQLQNDNQGIPVYKTWQTNNDGLVCPVCAPLNQQEVPFDDKFVNAGMGLEFDMPPGHTANCRCWMTVRTDILATLDGGELSYSTAREATPKEIEDTGYLYIMGDGKEMTDAQKMKVNMAVSEYESISQLGKVKEIVYVSGGRGDTLARSMGDGRMMVFDGFFDDDALEYQNKWFGGRKGILAHEHGHELAELLTKEEKQAYVDIHLGGRKFWRENRDKLVGDDYSDYDKIFLQYNPSYQSQNGWHEDIAEAYRIYVNSGGESGPLGKRENIIRTLIERVKNK